MNTWSSWTAIPLSSHGRFLLIRQSRGLQQSRLSCPRRIAQSRLATVTSILPNPDLFLTVVQLAELELPVETTGHTRNHVIAYQPYLDLISD